MQSRRRKLKKKRWERYLELAADAGAIAMSMRDRPRRLDWLAVGFRAVGLAIRVHRQHRRASSGSPWEYFTDEEKWIELPDELRALVLDLSGSVEIDEEYWDGDENSDYVCLGRVGDEVIGWIQDGDRAVDGPYVRRARETETYDAVGGRLWRRLGTTHATYSKTGLIRDPLAGAAVLPTEQVRRLADRVTRFLAHDIPRSYLLVGPPGTGKSSAIRYLTATLDLSSLRVELGVLAERHSYRAESPVAARLDTLLKLLRPEVLILDDIDRLPPSGDMLHFLELAARTCRVVLASANGTDKMIRPALRPGRFDEVIQFEHLDPDVLRRMVAPDTDLAEQLRALPAAYVAEFVKRRRVLGRDAAISEIADLARRVKLVDGDDADDDDD